jgi:hypothetical protein
MKTSRKQWIWGVVLTLLFIWLGAMREVLFVNINEQILFHEGGRNTYRVIPSLHFLGQYSIAELERWKWILTLLYMAMHLLLSSFALKQVFGLHGQRRWLLAIYALGFVIAGVSYVAGKHLGQAELGYTLSRVIMGALQSPFPLMLMIPALMLDKED